MRCNKCNVDLASEYTVCPLCGEKASNDAPLLTQMKTAAYPKYSDELLHKNHSIKSDYPFKYIFRISAVICIIIWIVYFVSKKEMTVTIIPAITGVNAVLYFILAAKEKGRLLHYGVSALVCAAFSMLMLLASMLAGVEILYFVIAACICMLSVLVLLLIRKDRMTAQLGAIFNI